MACTLLLVLCLCLVQALSQAASPSYSSCNPNSIFTVDSFDVTPYPPRKGKEVSFKAVFSSSDQVAGGTVKIEVRPTGFFSVIKKDFSYQLCNVLPTGCPVNKGKTTITATKTLPSSILSGTYKLNLKVRDHGGKELMCINAPEVKVA